MKKKQRKDPHQEREAAKYDNPVPSRELISEVLDEAPGPLSLNKVISALAVEDEDKQEAIRRRLNAMVRDGQLITNRRGEYGLINKMDLVRGRVQGHRDGFGFVIPSDGSSDVYLTNRQMQKVFDGDEVLVSPGSKDFKGRREGKIIEVIKRHTEQVVGRYMNQGGNHFVQPDNPRINHDIVIPPEDLLSAKHGQFVVAEITQHPNRHQKPIGRIVEVLGEHMAPGMEIDVAIRSYSIPHIWPQDVEQQATQFTEEVKESDKQNRIDLRKLPFVTIDGEDARDFDDAVYCEKKSGGGWRLYVAIADVSHYVAIDSPLDVEAQKRGTSVYFPDFVVPMLPHVLSNGLCSLNPHVDRLCMVCEMTVSEAGKITGYKFFEGLMHSHARLTYTQVGAMIDEAKKGGKKNKNGVRAEFDKILPHIDELYALYLKLRVAREERGAIDFESNETRIIFDQDRKISEIVPTIRNEAHKLIEECMLAANVCTAKFLESLEIPTLYRVHEGPKEEKLEMLQQFLGELGLGINRSKKISPQDYRDLLESVEGRPDAHLIQTVMLRSMNQARYQPENLGHFGLAYMAYTHFTSPIRRYPDLLVHRAIRAFIRTDKRSQKVKRPEGVQTVAFEKSYPYGNADMVAFGEQSSTTERRADEATRDVLSWLKCEYLQERVGEEFDGLITAVTSFGLFVELNNLYVEGLVHITALPQDYYHHEAAQHRLVGERSKRVFRIGDELRVKVVRVNLDERKIDFDFVQQRASKGKGKTKGRFKSAMKSVGDKAKEMANDLFGENSPRKVRKRKLKEQEAEDKKSASAKPANKSKQKSQAQNRNKPKVKPTADSGAAVDEKKPRRRASSSKRGKKVTGNPEASANKSTSKKASLDKESQTGAAKRSAKSSTTARDATSGANKDSTRAKTAKNKPREDKSADSKSSKGKEPRAKTRRAKAPQAKSEKEKVSTEAPTKARSSKAKSVQTKADESGDKSRPRVERIIKK